MTPSKTSLADGPLALEQASRSRQGGKGGAGFAETFEKHVRRPANESAAPVPKSASTHETASKSMNSKQKKNDSEVAQKPEKKVDSPTSDASGSGSSADKPAEEAGTESVTGEDAARPEAGAEGAQSLPTVPSEEVLALGEGGKVLPQSAAILEQGPSRQDLPAELRGTETATKGAGPLGDIGNGNGQDSRAPFEKTSESLLMAVRLGLGQGAKADPAAGRSATAALVGADASLVRVAGSDGMPGTSGSGTFSPLLNAATAASGTAATASTSASLNVSAPMGQSGWDRAMGERMVWMVRQGVQEAQIQLTPRDMGPVEVKISVHQDQASVAFTVHNPHAREALETALPRLRDMMAESGFNLVQSDVSQQSPHQRQGEGGHSGTPGSAATGGTVEADDPISERTPIDAAIRGGAGMLDFYA